MGIAILITVLAVLTGCESQRERLMREAYPAYPDAIKRAIERNTLLRGMDRDQVFLSLGEPICKRRIERDGAVVELWLYPPGGRDPCRTAEFQVYFEQGRVTQWQTAPGPRGGGS